MGEHGYFVGIGMQPVLMYPNSLKLPARFKITDGTTLATSDGGAGNRNQWLASPQLVAGAGSP